MRSQFVSVQLHVNEETEIRAALGDAVALVEFRTGQGDITIAAGSASELHDILTAAALKLEQAAS